LLGARNFDHLAALPLDAHRLQRLDLALVLALAAHEFLGGDGEFTLAALFMARRRAQLGRPVRPDQRLVFLLGRHRQQLELSHALGPVTVAGAHAVAAGVTATDDDHVLALGAQLVLDLAARVDLVLRRQEFHREVNAFQVAARHRQVARHLGAASQDHGVELRLELLGRDCLGRPVGDRAAFAQRLLEAAHHHAGPEGHAFGSHLLDAAVDVRLFHLEVRNAVAQQAAHRIVLFEQGDVVAGTRQLLRRGHAGRAGADDGNGLACLDFCQTRHDPAFSPGAVDDRVLDALDAHRVVVDIQRAGRFARCRADAAGELGEVVGRIEYREGIFPVGPVHQVVEVRNDVVDRATAVAERRAAVHAAGALDFRVFFLQADDELFVVLDTFGDGLVALFQTLVLHESSDFSHDVFCARVAGGVLTWRRRRLARLARPGSDRRTARLSQPAR